MRSSTTTSLRWLCRVPRKIIHNCSIWYKIISVFNLLECCFDWTRYNAYEYYERNPELRQCIEQIRSGFYSPSEPGRFAHLADVLLQHDRFLHLADFDQYLEAQQKVSDAYQVCYDTY